MSFSNLYHLINLMTLKLKPKNNKRSFKRKKGNNYADKVKISIHVLTNLIINIYSIIISAEKKHGLSICKYTKRF